MLIKQITFFLKLLSNLNYKHIDIQENKHKIFKKAGGDQYERFIGKRS